MEKGGDVSNIILNSIYIITYFNYFVKWLIFVVWQMSHDSQVDESLISPPSSSKMTVGSLRSLSTVLLPSPNYHQRGSLRNQRPKGLVGKCFLPLYILKRIYSPPHPKCITSLKNKKIPFLISISRKLSVFYQNINYFIPYFMFLYSPYILP